MYDKFITDEQIKQYDALNMGFIVNGKPILKPQILMQFDDLTITTKNGYIFDDFNPLYYLSSFNIPYKFELSTDKRDWTVNVGKFLPYVIKPPTVIKENVETLGVINKLFIMNRKQVHELLHARVQTFIPALNQGISTFDFDQFINNLHVIPFEIPKDIISELKNINLGMLKIDVFGSLLKTDQLEIDFDPIVMPAITDSTQIDSEVEILLPFMDSMTLEPSDIFGSDVKVKMSIDLNSGETTYLVSSSKSGLLDMKVKTIGTDIPLSNTNIEPNRAVLSATSSLSSVNDIYQPIVKVRNYVNKEVAEDFFGSYETKVGKLEKEVGYFEINNINLNDVNLDLNEKEEKILLQYLRGGIIIKPALTTTVNPSVSV